MTFQRLHRWAADRLGVGCMLVVLGTFGLCVPQGAYADDGGGARVKVVEASGAGADVESARKDACREAVRQVVGAYVNAKTRTENDELIEDKVISLSSGFVEKVERLKESTSDGLVRVRIRATVRISRVLESLKENAIAVSDVDGESLGAQLLTRGDQRKGADELIKAAFEGFPAKWFRASVDGKPRLGEPAGGGKTPLFVTVVIEPDGEAFLASIAKLDEALKATDRPGGEFTAEGEKCGYGGNWNQQAVAAWLQRFMHRAGEEKLPVQSLGFFRGEDAIPNDAWRPLQVMDTKYIPVVFPVRLLPAGKWVKWKWYGLTREEATKALGPLAAKKLTCEATLVDEGDRDTDLASLALERMGGMTFAWEPNQDMIFTFRPFLLAPGYHGFNDQRNVATTFTRDLKFVLSDEEIRNIRKVRVTLK